MSFLLKLKNIYFISKNNTENSRTHPTHPVTMGKNTE